jgi:hypothetical protein
MLRGKSDDVGFHAKVDEKHACGVSARVVHRSDNHAGRRHIGLIR